MVEIYGREVSRTELAARTGGLQQVAGVELMELADGPERGVRVLVFRAGAGLSFLVAVDRAFDLLGAARCEDGRVRRTDEADELTKSVENAESLDVPLWGDERPRC